ncbi:hypothetical protein EW146_g1710, partial [Bondarzewia mesenterica]
MDEKTPSKRSQSFGDLTSPGTRAQSTVSHLTIYPSKVELLKPMGLKGVRRNSSVAVLEQQRTISNPLAVERSKSFTLGTPTQRSSTARSMHASKSQPNTPSQLGSAMRPMRRADSVPVISRQATSSSRGHPRQNQGALIRTPTLTCTISRADSNGLPRHNGGTTDLEEPLSLTVTEKLERLRGDLNAIEEDGDESCSSSMSCLDDLDDVTSEATSL